MTKPSLLLPESTVVTVYFNKKAKIETPKKIYEKFGRFRIRNWLLTCDDFKIYKFSGCGPDTMPKYREPEPEPTPATPEEKSEEEEKEGEEEDNAPNYDGQFGKKSYFIAFNFSNAPQMQLYFVEILCHRYQLNNMYHISSS